MKLKPISVGYASTEYSVKRGIDAGSAGWNKKRFSPVSLTHPRKPTMHSNQLGTNGNNSDWVHKFTFYALLEGGTVWFKQFCVGQYHASSPTKHAISNAGHCDNDGWVHAFDFWAHTEQKTGTLPFVVSYNENTSIYRFAKGVAVQSGWTKLFVFWAYPTNKSPDN